MISRIKKELGEESPKVDGMYLCLLGIISRYPLKDSRAYGACERPFSSSMTGGHRVHGCRFRLCECGLRICGNYTGVA